MKQKSSLTFLLRSNIALTIAAAFLLTVAFLPVQSPRADESKEKQAEKQVDIFWCPMRGKPCELKDHTSPGTCKDCSMKLVTKKSYLAYKEKLEANQKKLGVVLYPGFELLDVCGPLEMWSYVKEFNIILIAEKKGRINSIQGVPTIAEYSFEDCPDLDIIMVPGGMGTLKQIQNKAMLEFIKKQNEKTELTTSVCSGSWVLAKAGVLDGRKATSNKLYYSHVAAMSDKVEWVPKARWVDDGKFITSSGVSAGIDMSLHLIERLYGKTRATKIANLTEYRWNRDPENDPFAKE